MGAVFGGPGDQLMSSVADIGGGLVAVGRVGTLDDGDAVVWLSTDGRVWSRVPHDEAVLGGPGRQSMLSVAAAGGGLVAVGWHGSDAAVWVSPPVP